MKLDILAFAAHPDDVELSCSGTLIKHIEAGGKAGVVDLTRGELGTRGTAETREVESKRATEIMGIHARENLGMADGFFEVNEKNLMTVVRMIRKYRPEIVLANAIDDRHPDHGRASKLVSDACFLSGLIKVSSHYDGKEQEAWRPKAVYHYIQDRYIRPDFIVDISTTMEKRMEAIMAFSTQFFDPNSNEPSTAISSIQFIEGSRGRARQFGRLIGAEYGEGFTTERIPGVSNLFQLL